MRKKTIRHRKSAFITLVFFIAFAESVFLRHANALSPQEITLPENLGFIVQTYEPPAGSGKKLIIHIQDLHVHYEAQKNLAQILEKFIKDYKLNLILVEGGWGDVSLSYLRDYGSKEKRLEVAEKYLKSGEISGEEYLDIISDYPLKLQGIEDENLYNEHIKLFLEVEKFQAKAKAYIQGLKDIAEELKLRIYSRSLQELSQAQNDKDENKITLVNFCAVLAEKSRRVNLELSEWQDFSNFVELARLEKTVDFKKADEERKYLIAQLTPVLNEQDLKSVSDEALKQASAKPLDYYLRLDDLAKNNLPDYTKSMWSSRTYANLNSYIKYLKASQGIDLGRLSSQIEALANKIKEKLFASEEEKRLAEISDNLKLLDNLINLKLSPEEYTAYLNKKSTLSLKDDVNFLKERAAKYNLAKSPDTDYTIIENNVGVLDNFYKIAEERNVVFIRNIVSLMNDNDTDIACLITGGFHTPFIIEQLKEKGVSYCVVAPRITQPADDALYVKILKEKAGIK